MYDISLHSVVPGTTIKSTKIQFRIVLKLHINYDIVGVRYVK